jgi:DNA ligase-1
MKFSELSDYLEKLEKTSSRLAITEILSDLFKKVEVSEIDKVTYLILGKLAPGYKGIVFNMADKLLIRVIAMAYETSDDQVLSEYKKLGDIGETAQVFASDSKNQTKSSNLSITDVYNGLLKVAADKGEDSVERKIEELSKLLSSLDPLSVKYLARIPVGRLRLGFSDKTILDALSWMETNGKGKKSELEAAYNILPDVGLLAKAVKEKGINMAAKNISPVLGVPILPMLAARLKSPTEMIAKMKKVLVEPKFDGLRIQIHYKRSGFENGEAVKAFTRNLNETSWMFPELAELGKHINAEEAILDTEAVGVDEERSAMANFQTTMTRRRKHDIEEMAKKVSITFNVFDIMYKDGESHINTAYVERRKILSLTVKDSNLMQIVDYVVTEDPIKIGEMMALELGEGLEGIIVKKADSGYIAGRTGFRWVKMKESEGQKAKLADTIDAVVMGYYRGKGKRTTFGLGGFLIGIPDGEVIKTLTKIGTGLTDDQFRELKQRLNPLEVKDKPKEYGIVEKILIPDVWVTPSLVVEIAADDITKSPNHSSGFALRFPRLVKFRDDKDPERATTLGEIKKLYKIQ